LAQKVLVFDDQHNLWTNVFASIYDCSSQDAKVTWTKALRKQHLKTRHYEDHKKINKYQAKSKKRKIETKNSVATSGLAG
jgi:histidyl-tRNA synthetase